MTRVPAALVALAAVAVAGCSSTTVPDLPPPPTTVAPFPPTTVVDYSGVDLKPVPGSTTTVVEMGPGRASMTGAVVGPDGPVPGAVVHVERLVGDAVGVIDVVTAADGTWVVTNIKGGRYRVRAWRPADLALVRPEVFYLADGEGKTLNLQLARYTGLQATAAVAPNPPEVDAPANLVVQVVQQSVDNQGVVRGTPVPGVRAQLVGSGDWRLRSPNPAVTDAGGRVTWQVVCQSAGQQALSVLVADQHDLPLELPNCVDPPPPPSSSTSSSSSSTSSSSTTRPTATTR